jgi:hypothetical protein
LFKLLLNFTSHRCAKFWRQFCLDSSTL